MVGLDDFAPFFLASSYHLALSLPPFSVFLFEIVGSSPLSYYPFVLLGRFIRNVGYCPSADKELFWEDYHILIIFFSLIIIRSPR